MNGTESVSQRWIRIVAGVIATGFGVVYLTPVAKATLASAVATVVYAGIRWGDDGFVFWLPLLIAVTFLVGAWASSRIATEQDPDPSRAVIDEFAGQWAALLFLPVHWQWMLSSFVLFRLFDVMKPFGIRRLEKVPHGWGIMLDDLAAGILTALILNVTRLLIDAYIM